MSVDRIKTHYAVIGDAFAWQSGDEFHQLLFGFDHIIRDVILQLRQYKVIVTIGSLI